MSTDEARTLAYTFLAVSLVSLTVYLTALVALIHGPTPVDRPAYHGLVRTAASRVFVACLYVGLGISIVRTVISPWATLIVFTAAQLCWQTNALLDLRLRRRLRKGQ